MLPSDNRRAAIRAAQTIVDPRVRHFHDPKKRAGKIIARSLGEPDYVAWDIYLFYPVGSTWDTLPSVPSHWAHQVSEHWADHFHYGDDLANELHKIARRLMAQYE